MSSWKWPFGRKKHDDAPSANPPNSSPPPAGPSGDSPLTTAASVLVWKARPIFVSSTFRDMHPERDYLRRNGFLRLAEQLRERCHHLDTIDLRQGVESAGEADEAKREMQVLKVCLDEIERSKPFLVALLGDRYGWIPPAARIAAAARDAGLPDSVEVVGRSVTELEILYAVLENPDQRKRSWFYFRTLDRAGMPPAVSAHFLAEEPSDDPASPADRLRMLKNRIRREMPDRVRDYTLRWDTAKQELSGLDELDRQITTDLWADLDTETVAYLRQAPKTWQEADARAVTDFVAERKRGYVERPTITDPMLAHALSPTATDAVWGLSVTGESGGGKSSLFGRVYDALQPRSVSGEIVLLAHAVGIFPMSGQVDRMLRRWVSELAASLDRPDPLERPVSSQMAEPEATSKEIDEAFATLLGQAATQSRVVVLVDALNQFEPTVRAQHVTWLPGLWPENARFIATAIPCQATATLAERPGCRELPMPPVSPVEAREIARRFYRERHHRDTNPQVLDALLAKQLPDNSPAHGNPLWLALALQEMNLLEADDFERAEREYAHLAGAERMQALQLDEVQKLAADVYGLYGELLDRAERGFGKAWAGAFAALIAVSRAGWRESDLRGLMPAVSGQPWDDLAFADVRRALGPHVVQRGAQAQWNFFHAALRDSVLHRDLAENGVRRRLHGLIADHLEGLPPGDPLRIGESMFHLIGLGDRDRAADNLGAIQPLQWSDAEAKSALAASVAVIVQAVQSAADDAARERLTKWIATLMDGDNDERAGRVAQAFVFDLNDALAITGEARTEGPRFDLLRSARRSLAGLASADPSNAVWQHDLSVSHNKIGDVLVAQGDLAGALNAYRESLGVAEILASADPSNAGWQRDLSVSHNKIGDVLVAQGDLAGALKAYREVQAILQ
jgi:tetratricopeptide (TPR) repeat protein